MSRGSRKPNIALKACHRQEEHSALAPNALNALHLGAVFIAALRTRKAAFRLAAGRLRTALDIVPNL